MSEKTSPSGERLAKVIARAGVCSRREAESYITEGRIAVNGSVVRTPAFNVVDADTIAVDGKPIARKQATQLWLYHKPAGLMVTEKDPEGRPTVFEAFTRLGLPRVVTVGRLDYNTEGLLLLTNDGGLKRTLELPSTGWVRRYRVRAFGSVTQEQLNTLADGITVEGIDYGPIEAELDSVSGSNVWITVGLREGKNREVRNVLGALGLEVNRLIRLSYGPFQLGDLPAGHVEKVKSRILQDQLGRRLAENAGADFDSPMEEEAGQPRRRAPERPASQPTERDRYTGLRKRPEYKRPEAREAAPRTVHFDDGRPPQKFTPQGDPTKRGRDGDFKSRGDRPAREGGFNKRFENNERPHRDAGAGDRKRPFAKKPYSKDVRDEGGSRPYRDKPEGERRPFRKDEDRPLARRTGPSRGDKPFGDRPPRRDGDKPFGARPPRRDGDKPFGARPPRRDGDKPFGARPPRRDGDKPFGARPPRRDGDKPFGDRPPRRDGDKPFAKGPRRDKPQGERSFAKGPGKGPGRDRGDKPFGPRSDKPFAKGPRPQRPTESRGDRKPFTGNRPERPRRPRKPEDE
ncbi:pseudouridine synthase [Pelagibacterium luteolum]|uniref:Pseudouridine synthase n=1 Tax=Pelagibacterium luteolum TaxID=440168 RepID=A0A1G7U1W9_9HYPH|nr:pseudouridine synthase [Pelagibacterium luteolum]SDG40790.1 23S rRNA pseudouridine2605 synthase [Pelagibacterium luteolum]